jgi:uncharacterized protein YbcV (DUF1398 family)
VQQSIQHVIQQCARDAHAGKVSFGAVVGALKNVGIESYHADYRSASTTYYLPTGPVHSHPLETRDVEIPQPFDAAALQDAIHGAQRGEVKYPDFLKLSIAAGCVGYIVWIAGEHVSYFGHKGETHREPFPTAT